RARCLRMLDDPKRLRLRLESLLDEHKGRPFSPDEAAAASECAFRLAVHPDTEPSQSFALLQRSIRWDKSNPKYSYHLARLSFIYGNTGRAAQWLQATQRVCPTSH